MDEAAIRSQTIYLTKHGSVAYGTNTPHSDVDEKGVAVMTDPAYYFGYERFEQKDSGWVDGNDRVIYDIRKFVALASDCNPNIVEVLYVDKKDIIKITWAGLALLDMREMFLSQKAAYTFGGYAHSQLKRMEGHHRWLNTAPTEPKVESFTNKHKVAPGTKWNRKLGGHEITVSMSNLDTIDIDHIDHEAFDAAKKDYKNYVDWKANRNAARAAIEAEHGYDCKHAYHLIRLLRMAKEIVGEGKVLVKRPDREELLAIRNGKYTYKELIGLAEELKYEVDLALLTSPLPKDSDRKAIQKRLIDIIHYCRMGETREASPFDLAL
jgi:uncharacterized protein